MGNVLNLTSLCLYPINVESAPNWVMRKAFERSFAPFYEYDWFNLARKNGLKQTHEDFIKFLQKNRPEYCFMQIQSPDAMDVETIKRMAKFTKIINWTGDVKNEQPWYRWLVEIGKHVHLTLFTNQTDVEILREHGCRADYLQVGFDNVWYNKRIASSTGPEIVFCANEYGNFPLSNQRVHALLELRKMFGPHRVGIYGNGWLKYEIRTSAVKNVTEAQLYNNAKIALSISNLNLERYHSDRLLRIMACGCLPMSHNFRGWEKDFKNGSNIVIFENVTDLIGKCKHYLENDAERQIIADNAYINAHSNHTWAVRCQQLIQLLKKYN